MRTKYKFKSPPSQRGTASHRDAVTTLHLNKARIAEAVHEAVCTITESSGLGHCLLYAHAGWGLLRHLGVEAHVQAGGHGIVLNDARLMAGTSHGSLLDVGSLVGGDYHAWLAPTLGKVPAAAGTFSEGKTELIDFSSRHYRHYVLNCDRKQDYDGRPYPDFVWTANPRSDFAVFEVEEVTTSLAANVLAVGEQQVMQLWRTAIAEYKKGG